MVTLETHAQQRWLTAISEPAGVVITNGTALTVVILHLFIDFHIGLFGESSEAMTLAQAANAFQFALTAGGWMIALGMAMRGSRTGTACALVFVVFWGLLINGLVAFLIVPPPSAAYPYQDIAHVGGIVFGGLATYALWGQLKRLEGPIDRRYVLLTLAWLLLISPLLGIFASPVMG